jgi:sugar phosphate isomerase/epimerase
MLDVSLADAPLPVAAHHPLGASTGWLREVDAAWPALARRAMRTSSFAAELAALDEAELPSLVDYLHGRPALPFRYLSVHAPAKNRRMPEAELVAMLAALPECVDAIVAHPDTLEEPERWRALGARLVLENMDARKDDGRTVAELEPYFAALPHAGLCFDVAHAWSLDPSMAAGHAILDAHAPRLRHLHISSLDFDGHHRPLSVAHEALFAPLLRRCRDVPWILEAPLTSRG